MARDWPPLLVTVDGTAPARRCARVGPPARAMALAAMGVFVSCLDAWSAPIVRPQDSGAAEQVERSLLGSKNTQGLLIQVVDGAPHQGLGISIHGINASPADVAPLTEELVARGAETLTFAYDDEYRRLRDNAADLAAAIRPHLADRPGEPLLLWAHSMGARVVLAALERLARTGALDGRDVEVALVAPPLGGYVVANLARFGGHTILGPIRAVRPALDMGTTSGFQRDLEALSLPANVRVRVFLASDDHAVNARRRRLWRVITRVNAEVVRLPDSTHESAVGAAADWLRVDREARSAEAHHQEPYVTPAWTHGGGHAAPLR